MRGETTYITNGKKKTSIGMSSRTKYKGKNKKKKYKGQGKRR